MTFHHKLGAFVVVALLPLGASAAPFYVSDSGSFSLFAIVDSGHLLTPPGISYSSGNLQQLSVTGGNNTSIAGSLQFGGTGHIQSADGSIADSAQIGSLHTLVKANAITDNYPYGSYFSATATSDIQSICSWFDTVTFRTSNPAGSDFTASIFLHDDIQNSATQQTGSNYSIGSRAAVSLDITGLSVSHPTLAIADSEYLHSDGPISNPPPAFVQSITFHAINFQTLTFLETLDVRSTALGGNTGTLADVFDTAGFLLFSSDPAASYTTASGVTFAPEPSCLSLLILSTALLLRRGHTRLGTVR